MGRGLRKLSARQRAWPKLGEGDASVLQRISMTVPYALAERRPYARAPRRGPVTRLLEDERWLALVLMIPTLVLLALFIAYPFVKGVVLSVADAKVGCVGAIVGLVGLRTIASEW